MTGRANTVAKLALALAKRQQQNASAAADLMAKLAQDKVDDLRAAASPALDRKAGEDLVREVFAMESMVRGVFAELKDELRGKDGRNVEPAEAEALVRAVVQEIAPSLRGKDGDNATDAMVADAVASWLRANPPKPGKDGENVTPEQLAKAVAAYLAANPPKPGKDGDNATPAMVATAVAAYLKANPPKAGPPGPPPAHEVKGRKLRFKNPDGSWGSWLDLGGKGTVVHVGGGVPGGGGSATAETAYKIAIQGQNTSGAAIAKGTPVMATGTLGASGIITIAPMDGTDPASYKYLIGVAGADIAVDSTGDVVDIGKVRGFNTTAWAEGDVLWVSPATVGALTNVEPQAGQIKMPIAFVVTDHAQNGEIMVRVTPLDENSFAKAGAGLDWGYYKDHWSVAPTLLATIAAGDVWSYTLSGVTRYRLIPATYTPAQDAFYSQFTGGVLSGLIATRG